MRLATIYALLTLGALGGVAIHDQLTWQACYSYRHRPLAVASGDEAWVFLEIARDVRSAVREEEHHGGRWHVVRFRDWRVAEVRRVDIDWPGELPALYLTRDRLVLDGSARGGRTIAFDRFTLEPTDAEVPEPRHVESFDVALSGDLVDGPMREWVQAVGHASWRELGESLRALHGGWIAHVRSTPGAATALSYDGAAYEKVASAPWRPAFRARGPDLDVSTHFRFEDRWIAVFCDRAGFPSTGDLRFYELRPDSEALLLDRVPGPAFFDRP